MFTLMEKKEIISNDNGILSLIFCNESGEYNESNSISSRMDVS